MNDKILECNNAVFGVFDFIRLSVYRIQPLPDLLNAIQSEMDGECEKNLTRKYTVFQPLLEVCIDY